MSKAQVLQNWYVDTRGEVVLFWSEGTIATILGSSRRRPVFQGWGASRSVTFNHLTQSKTQELIDNQKVGKTTLKVVEL